ncbi:hypothetical protein SLEP1_g28787 [Rubroshorea leprosula]|uniref:Uncharacterized protein n=1 Tax=Rubroshorea leprosula TaxID=152421 RepID=A0AAV5K3E9_9ROSI|nr:hypothetical protein SLEP1_g28787 [Rubroshorea leprosula]
MLEEIGRELDFSLLFLSKNLIWNPEISPPAGSFRICAVLPPLSAGCSCLWGVICSGFGSVSFSPALAAGLLPNLHPGSAACKFWFPIVLSVST